MAERILDAATSLFLEQGFGRTTLDQVATSARTGKSSVYGYFKNKPTLFSAVVHHSIELMFAEMGDLPQASGVEERLRSVGLSLIHSLLVPRCAALMRITAAEAETMPDLARSAYQISFEGSLHRVKAVLDDDPSFKERDTTEIATRFIEIALQPLSFQAAFGGDLALLRSRSANDIEDALLLLKAKKLIG